MRERKPLFSDHFPNYDTWAQLRSIRALIDTIFTWRNSLHGKIAEAEHDLNSSNEANEMAAHAVLTDKYYQSIYRDAAAVQAAVGALAPFLEGFFVHAFTYLRILQSRAAAPTEHPRWQNSVDRFWNPREPGIAEGVRDLCDALALHDWLTDDALDRIELLFVFRNRSLHFAYEWPRESLDKFKCCVEQKRWANHVEWATVGDEPWMAYLNDTFLSKILQTTEHIVCGFVKVSRDQGGLFRADPSSLPGSGPGEARGGERR